MISLDVMFDEKATWDWGSLGIGEADGVHDTFIVKHLVIHGGGDAGQVERATDVGISEAAVAPDGSVSPPTVGAGEQTPMAAA